MTSRHPAPTLPGMFAAVARRSGANVAIVQDGREVTYAQLDAWARSAAHHLVEAGVAPGDVVAVEWRRSPESVAAVIGVLAAGAAFLPLRDTDPPGRRRAVFADAGVRTVVMCAGALERGHDDAAHEFLTLDELLRETSPTPQLPHIAPEANAYVIATSGSTGVPKGVAVPHRGVVNHIEWECRTFPDLPHETILQNSPLAFDAAIWEIFTPLCTGGRLALLPASGGHDDTARTVSAHGVTTIGFVPTTLEALLDDGQLARCRASVRRVIVGGETLHQRVVDAFVRTMETTRLINVYGATEASIDSTWQLEPFPEGRITVGKPIANTRIDIVDEHLRPVPASTVGEIVIAGAGVANGYIARPDETARAFVPDPQAAALDARRYRTGDMGRLLADGTLDFLGRRDDQVKVAGVRIELGEVEAALSAHRAVRRAVALTVEGERAAPELVAAVVVGDTATPEEIREAARARLPAEMVPQEIRVVDELPTTASGKIDRPAVSAGWD